MNQIEYYVTLYCTFKYPKKICLYHVALYQSSGHVQSSAWLFIEIKLQTYKRQLDSYCVTYLIICRIVDLLVWFASCKFWPCLKLQFHCWNFTASELHVVSITHCQHSALINLISGDSFNMWHGVCERLLYLTLPSPIAEEENFLWSFRQQIQLSRLDEANKPW